jgi:hypothetical protein
VLEILILPAVSLAVSAAAYCFWYFSAEQTMRRAILAAARKRIREAREGEIVRIVGRLEYVGAPLHAPLSEKSCAYYRVTIRENDATSGIAIDEQEAQPFLVADPTGSALVETRDAKFYVVRDVDFGTGMFDDVPAHVETYLRKHGESARGEVFDKKIKYLEGTLRAGEEVAVVGEAHWAMDPDPTATDGYRGRARRLVLRAPKGGWLIVSDHRAVVR